MRARPRRRIVSVSWPWGPSFQFILPRFESRPWGRSVVYLPFFDHFARVTRCRFFLDRFGHRHQLKIHLARLVEMEYLVAHRARANGLEYELVYDVADADDTLRFPGLADIEALKYAYDTERSGQNKTWSGAGRPSVGPWPGGGRGEETAPDRHPASVSGDSSEIDAKPHLLHCNTKTLSYPQPAIVAAPAHDAAP